MKRIVVLLVIGLGLAAVLWGATSIKTVGNVEAAAFVGDGSQVTNVNAAMLEGNTSGDFADARATAAEIVGLQSQINATEAALQRQLLCREGAIRYLDFGDGTVWDCKHKLQWLKDSQCLGSGTFDEANGSVLDDFNAGTTGSSCDDYTQGSYSDWRLATSSEWSAAMADGNALDPQCESPGLTSDLGAREVEDFPEDGVTGWVGTCASDGPFSFTGAVSGFYWSSTTFSTAAGSGYIADTNPGSLFISTKDTSFRVWPVRGGP